MATEKEMQEVIEQAEISHRWMLAHIKHKADELQDGNYSDQLKGSIVVQEMLEIAVNGL